MSACPYRRGLPQRPERMASLPLDHRGYPVPRFVEMVNGSPDFRVMSMEHFKRCVRDGACWVCGQPLGSYKTFVVGPMCVVNRTSGEPPSHHDCAVYSATACPFLTLPRAKRNESGLDELGAISNEGALKHNPGVTALYVSRSYRLFRAGESSVLVRMGEPERVEWYREGRPATRAEVLEAFERGLPALRKIAEEESASAELELAAYEERAMALVPA